MIRQPCPCILHVVRISLNRICTPHLDHGSAIGNQNDVLEMVLLSSLLAIYPVLRCRRGTWARAHNSSKLTRREYGEVWGEYGGATGKTRDIQWEDYSWSLFRTVPRAFSSPLQVIASLAQPCSDRCPLVSPPCVLDLGSAVAQWCTRAGITCSKAPQASKRLYLHFRLCLRKTRRQDRG